MIVFIPSRSRADRVARGPLRQFSPTLRSQTMVVVPEHQYVGYSTALDQTYGATTPPVMRVPDEYRIAATRHRCGQVAAQLGHEHFMMVDDDVGFLVRRADDNWRLREAEPTEVEECLACVRALLHDFTHVGVSAREGNNRVGVGSRYGLFETNTRLLRAYAWRTEAFLRAEHGRVAVMEDFDVSLQDLRSGGQNACLYYWAQGQRETNESGGCSDYRTRELHEEEGAKKLAALHPEHVRLRQKQNKGGTLAERLEVTVSWKRAAEEGQRKKGETR